MVIQSNYKPSTTKFHYTMSLSVLSIYFLNTSQIFHRIFWVGQELSEENISQELWRNSVLPFCYHPSRLHSVTHIEIIWFALLHVRYLNKDGKYDIRSMETFSILKQARHPWASQNVADDFWCVNISVSVQSINGLMKLIARLCPLHESQLWSCLEGHSLDFFSIENKIHIICTPPPNGYSVQS